MSAVAGLVRLDGAPASAGAVRAMLAAMPHRAGGAVRVWSDGPAALAWAAGPSGSGAPPGAAGPAGASGSVLVADARLDDRDGLGAQLGLGPEATDAERLLAAHVRWGASAPAHVLGDYTVAVWDPDARRLTGWRDAVGARPFYVAHRPGRLFAFASEPRALLALPEVALDARPDADAVADYLAGVLSHTATLRSGVERLPAAHTLVLSERGLAVERYWALDPERGFPAATGRAYADGFREHFDAAVASRLGAPEGGRVGAALSGGLDSSSIAVTARDLRDASAGRLPVFTATFAGAPEAARVRSDEHAFARAVTAGGGVEPHDVAVDRLSPFAEADAVAWHLDDVLRTYNLYIHWALFREARAHGVRAFLDGSDGDAAVSHGYARLGELAAGGAWDELAAQVRALAPGRPGGQEAHLRRWARPELARLARGGHGAALAGALRALGRGLGPSPLALGVQHVLPAFVPRGARRVWRARRWGASTALPGFLRPDVARSSGALERLAEQDRPVPGETTRQAHVRGLASAVYPYLLESADRAAAAFGIEMRYPFFDRRLLEYAVALPAEQKLDGGWTRVVLREAMAGRLPEAVRTRPGKADLGPPFLLGLAGPDRDLLERTLRAPDLAVAPFVDVPAARAALARFTADPLRHAADGPALFCLVTLERWLRSPASRPRAIRLT